MSQPSLTNFIIKRPWLKRWMMPLAKWYVNAAGYRQLGLKYANTTLQQQECALCSSPVEARANCDVSMAEPTT